MKKLFDWIELKLVPKLNSIVPNPSGQNQLSDHTFGLFFLTALLLLIPKVGIYCALVMPVASLIKEFIVDEHWKDFFSGSDTGKDGRADLLYRLMGSALAYGYYFIVRR